MSSPSIILLHCRARKLLLDLLSAGRVEREESCATDECFGKQLQVEADKCAPLLVRTSFGARSTRAQ